MVVVVTAIIVIIGGRLVVNVLHVVVVVPETGSLKNLSSSPSSPFKKLSSTGRLVERPGMKWKESQSLGEWCWCCCCFKKVFSSALLLKDLKSRLY